MYLKFFALDFLGYKYYNIGANKKNGESYELQGT